MVLNTGSNLFGGAGLGVDETRTATIIVATDGSGDSDSIQEGINMLPPNGGVVMIKEGVFTISASISFPFDNIMLSGTGKATQLFSTSGSYGIYMNTKSHVIIENIFFNTTISNTGIFLATCNHIIIRNCWFTGWDNEAIRIAIGQDILIDGNMIYSNDTYGIYMFATGVNNCIRNKIINNFINNNGDHGVFLYSATGGNTDQNIIANNHIYSNGGYGIKLHNADCDRNLLIGNMVLSNTSGEILDNGTLTTLSGNLVA